MYTPPKLANHEGSWAIIRLSDGALVRELFRNSKLIKHLNAEKYKAIPITEHLSAMQSKIDKGEDHDNQTANTRNEPNA